MANQIAKNKQRLSLVLTKNQIKRLDGRAVELGVSRNELISQAVDAYLDGVDIDPAVSARLDVIAAKLDGLASGQDSIASAQGELKAQQLAQAAVIVDAVKNQPIAVQQQALPAPKVTNADVVEYIREKRPGIKLDMWGDPVEPTAKEVRAYLEGHYPGRFEFDGADEPFPARSGLVGKLFGRR